ncbi:MAG: RluA family pseudouridine synthase [Planctomycetes bacterium]|nr:RluA family pseudouridine synthase [Planctomycetota bacterium]
MPAPLQILFEDEHLLAVNKPPGLLSVALPHRDDPHLAGLVAQRARTRGERAHAVHRLDRETSGVVVFAKSDAAKAALDEAFRGRSVHKHYLALVHGRPKPAEGTIRSFIRDQGAHATSSRSPIPGGKSAITHYRVVEQFAHAALVACEPETGRFNQIRLHFVDRGHPLVGERKYAIASRFPLRFKRFVLHAQRLELPHPITRATLAIDAPLPRDVDELLVRLRSARA